jgi:formamidopyrimidine-DNA glycosylase
MPELPEVETLRLQLSSLIIGQTIKEIEILKAKSFTGDKREVIGKKIVGIRRFAKLLVFDLSNGLNLAIHLKMSGQLIYRNIKDQISKIKNKTGKTDPLLVNLPNKHTRVIIRFQSGANLYFNDLRIFGWIRVTKKVDDLIEKLGPEPFKDLTIDKFKEILHSSRKPIKPVIMDQEKIAGVGNIYANDVLFLAGIDPRKKANTLTDSQTVKLLNCLEKVLKDGIKWGGASEDNFRDAYGNYGKAQEHFCVYQRDGEKCLNNCGGTIERIKLGGRGTFFCPKCQQL